MRYKLPKNCFTKRLTFTDSTEVEICQTSRTDPAGFQNVPQTPFVKCNQISGRKPKISGRAQKILVITVVTFTCIKK